jgi:SAM-dependent methyltransferase
MAHEAEGRGHQRDFSRDNEAMHSREGRERKARTMLAVLSDHLGEARLSRARVLNVGCSTGLIDEVIATRTAHVVGIDIDEDAIAIANARRSHNTEFRIGDAMDLDFPDGSFDVVICSQVYEHVPDPQRMMVEIRRVMAEAGICYFAATNRWCVMEQHYRLPFLSVIPVSWAHRYLRVAGAGDFYYERHLGLRGLKRLVAAFAVVDYTRRIIDEPDRFEARYLVGSGTKQRIARLLARTAYWAFPGYVWLLRR